MVYGIMVCTQGFPYLSWERGNSKSTEILFKKYNNKFLRTVRLILNDF